MRPESRPGNVDRSTDFPASSTLLKEYKAETFGATAEFTSSAAARAAVARLIRAGFHRADIDTWPRDGAYLAHVRSGEDDHADAERALRERGSGLPPVFRSTGPRDVDRLLPLGLATLAGVVLYRLARRP